MPTTIDALLDDAERGRWPATSDIENWLVLANWAFQTECLIADEAENVAWEAQMKDLVKQGLPYAEFVEKRMEALGGRLKARKLAQTNLRYKYGFKPRREALVRRDVSKFYREWAGV